MTINVASGSLQLSGSYGWNAYSGNPIIPDPAGANLNRVCFADVIYDGTNFHLYGVVDGTTPGIYHYTSPDGLTHWTADGGNPVIVPGPSAYDASAVGALTAFLEAGTINILYKAVAGGGAATIALATAPVGTPGTFTKYGSNPVFAGAGANTFVGGGGQIEPGPGRCIKVGSTYYLFVSNVNASNASGGYQRAVGILSSTDLHSWSWAAATNATNDPVFSDGSLCNSVWTDGVFYYSLNCHMRTFDDAMIFELWRSPDVRFPYYNRDYLGRFRDIGNPGWELTVLDTPTVFTDTIQRNSFNATGGLPRVYYSGADVSGVFRQGALIPSLLTHPVPFDAQRVAALGQWNQANVAQSQAAVQMFLNDSAAQKFFTMPRAGSIVTIAGVAIPNISAGSITLAVTDAAGNAAARAPGLSVVIPGSRGTAQGSMASLPPGVWHFAGGDAVGVKITTTSDLAPANINLGVTLGVIFQ